MARARPAAPAAAAAVARRGMFLDFHPTRARRRRGVENTNRRAANFLRHAASWGGD